MLQKSLEVFGVEAEKPEKFKNIYITIKPTFEKFCKGCSELVKFEEIGERVRVFCKAEHCIK